jgi:hypothetical protein
MKKIALLFPALALSACVATAPVVTGFNGDSVEVQASSATNTAEVTAEATRICRTVRKRAEYASSRMLPPAGQYDFTTTYSHLFLCLS